MRTAQGKYADAEPILREALAGREKAMPNRWTRFVEQSLLGDSLVGQQKYAEAEPLLLSGYDGLIERALTISAYDRAPITLAAGNRILRLYEAWGKPSQATEWRKKLSTVPGQ